MRRIVVKIILAGTATVAISCSANVSEEPADDLSGLREVPAVVIWSAGSVDGGDVAFSEVIQARIGSAGSIYIVEREGNRIIMLDSAGHVVRQIGRPGAGPGEFEALSHILLRADTLYAADIETRRLTTFSLGGELLGSTEWASPSRVERGENSGVFYPATPPHAIMDDGSALVLAHGNSFSRYVPVTTQAIMRGESESVLLRISQSGEVLDTLATFRRTFGTFGLIDKGTLFRFVIPFNDDDLVAILPDASGAVILHRRDEVRGGRQSFRVTRIGTAGDTIFSRIYRSTPIRTADREIVAAANQALQTVYPAIDPPRVAVVAHAMRGHHLIWERTLPATSVVAGGDGTIWIRLADAFEATVSWVALTDGGDPMFKINVPRNIQILDSAGSLAVAVETDDLDVPYVSALTIQPVRQ